MAHQFRKHYTVAEARALLPEIRVWLGHLRDARQRLDMPHAEAWAWVSELSAGVGPEHLREFLASGLVAGLTALRLENYWSPLEDDGLRRLA